MAGAQVPMPGPINTVLDLGLSDETVKDRKPQDIEFTVQRNMLHILWMPRASC